MTREMIGIHITHSNRIRPEFIPQGEKAGLVIEVYLDEEYGAIAEVYPWGRMQEQMWNKRDREFAKLSPKEQAKIIAKQKKASEEMEKDHKPVDTSKWIHPRESDIKRQIACHTFYAFLSTSPEERAVYAGRSEAMLWYLFAKNPPSAKNIGWSNYSYGGLGNYGAGHEVNSLEGIIDILDGKAMTTSKYVASKFAKEEAKYNVKKKKDGHIEFKIDNHEDYLVYAKKLESKMVTVKTTVIDD